MNVLVRVGAVAIGLAMITATGCTHRVWFTHDLRESFELGLHHLAPGGEAGLGGEDKAHAPNELQYFVSQRIVLEREVSSRDSKLARGRIMVRNGRFIERIVVRRGTPGVAVGWGEDWVAVSFEKGTRLVFEKVDGGGTQRPGVERPPANYFGQTSPSTHYKLRVTKSGDRGRAVSFDGREYRPAGATENARLKVRRSAKTNRGRSRRVLRGRRI